METTPKAGSAWWICISLRAVALGHIAMTLKKHLSVLNGEVEVTFRAEKSVVHAGETVHIPANAPHQFHNTSANSARLICICSPAGQEKFFLEIGVPVATRTTAPPKLDDKQMAAFLEKAKALAPKYHTELLRI